MTDLVLQDLGDSFSKNVVQALLSEKAKMLGEEYFAQKKGKDDRLGSRRLAGSMRRTDKPGGRDVST
jgi:hypothetical protein